MQNGLRALAPRSTRILITDARLAERYCAQFYETDKRNKGYVSAAQKKPEIWPPLHAVRASSNG